MKNKELKGKFLAAYTRYRIEIFYLKLKKMKNGCWEWKGSRDKKGYGQFSFKERRIKTSRFSWEINNGKIPKGLFVCHNCDNPPCCNPEHLFLGTCQDNSDDMVKKGRHADCKGEKHAYSKLTEKQVKNILKENAKKKVNHTHTGKKYGVAPSTIKFIIDGLTWKHIDRSEYE